MTEMVETTENELTNPESMDAWGGADFNANDLVIPKIVPMQGMSKLVSEGDAKFGEFRELMNGEKVGSIDEPMEFIPFHVDKVWVETKDRNKRGKYEFAGIVPITSANEHWPKEGLDETGIPTRRDFTYYVYCILPGDVSSGCAMPYIISFKRTSRRAGQKIMTQMFMKNRLAGKNPAAKVMSLSGKKAQNENGTWIVLDATPTRDSTQEEMVEAFNLLKLVKSGRAKVQHDEGEVSDKQYASDDAAF